MSEVEAPLTADEIRQGIDRMPIEEVRQFLRDALSSGKLELHGPSGKKYDASVVNRMKPALARKTMVQALIEHGQKEST